MSAPANCQLNRRWRIVGADIGIAIISRPVRAGDDHDRRQSALFFNGLLGDQRRSVSYGYLLLGVR